MSYDVTSLIDFEKFRKVFYRKKIYLNRNLEVLQIVFSTFCP